MKTGIVLILAVLSQAGGNTMLSKGMKELTDAAGMQGDPGVWWMVLHALGSPSIFLGTMLMVVFFVLFSAALSWEDLSFVLPATSLGYVLNLAFAHHFLHEAVPPIRWYGTVLISLGVLLVAKSGTRSAREISSPAGGGGAGAGQ
jgi:drug/metabolite transporter (DMT)-like permease